MFVLTAGSNDPSASASRSRDDPSVSSSQDVETYLDQLFRVSRIEAPSRVGGMWLGIRMEVRGGCTGY